MTEHKIFLIRVWGYQISIIYILYILYIIYILYILYFLYFVFVNTIPPSASNAAKGLFAVYVTGHLSSPQRVSRLAAGIS